MGETVVQMVLGQRRRQLHSRETAAKRASLPNPRPPPFLLIDGRTLVCPWQRRPKGQLLPAQTARLEAVRAQIAATAVLPLLAWVSVEAGISPIPQIPEGWLAGHLHDGQVVPAARL